MKITKKIWPDFCLPGKIAVAMMLHSDEKLAKGGPSRRAPHTAELMRQNTMFEARIFGRFDPLPQEVALAHVYNLSGDNESCNACIDTAWRNGVPVVLSSIFIDERETRFFRSLRRIFQQHYSDADQEERLKRFSEDVNEARARGLDSGMSWHEQDRIQDAFNKSAHLILLSEHERALLQNAGFELPDSTVAFNPVDCGQYAGANPEIFAAKFGIKDYLLCVGRVEPRKNQLMLAHALKGTNIPIVLAGHCLDKEYGSLVRSCGGDNVFFVNRLEDIDLLASAYAGARVYCLPSWAEGASLANLEAAASGCRLVLSNRSSEKEYFGDFAEYCDPAMPESIRNAVLTAWDKPMTGEQGHRQMEFIAREYSWTQHIAKTARAYAATLDSGTD